MKKLLAMLLATMFSVAMLSSFAYADYNKGQKIIQKKISKVCKKAGIKDGGVLAAKHTQAEWKAIYDSGKLNEELQTLCPGVKELKDKYAKHVFDFLFYYANDSGNVPS